jgi:hypothetical protein
MGKISKPKIRTYVEKSYPISKQRCRRWRNSAGLMNVRCACEAPSGAWGFGSSVVDYPCYLGPKFAHSAQILSPLISPISRMPRISKSAFHQ